MKELIGGRVSLIIPVQHTIFALNIKSVYGLALCDGAALIFSASATNTLMAELKYVSCKRVNNFAIKYELDNARKNNGGE